MSKVSFKDIIGKLWGAIALEQRSSAAEYSEQSSPAQSAGKGEKPMKVRNNTDAPCAKSVHWHHVFLVSLHFIVFVLSAFSQSFTIDSAAAGALPEAFR
ncbi:MAG: hypothetical protein E2O79_05565 [Caldithrix sp.]|nr:MAG: hypothetical protein E2O79_05565 [Caldithrix sp.]